VNTWFGKPSGDFAYEDQREISVKPAGESAAFGPWDLLSADFNSEYVDGDGADDMVTANNLSGTISVLLRQPGEWFEEPTTYRTGVRPVRVQTFVSPQEEDPQICLATANQGGGSISIFVGDGDGTFDKRDDIELDPEADPTSIVIGPFNVDGYADLLACNEGNNTVSWVRGNAGYEFDSPIPYDVASGTQPRACVAGFFDSQDSLLDVAIANSGLPYVTTLLGQVDATGEIWFPESILYSVTTGVALSIVSGYFNADDFLDVAVANSSTYQIDIYRGEDANEDGYADGTFVPFQSVSVLDSPQHLIAADINGDDILDLLLTTWKYDAVYVFYGQGDGSFEMTLLGYDIAQPTGLTVLEATDDGVLDLAVASYLDDVIHVFPGVLDQECVGWHCYDGIQNYDECATDCGGSCAPCDECDSGPCCDLLCGLYRPPTEQCDTYPERRCSGTECGADVEERPVDVYCSGESEVCDGALDPGPWEPIEDCADDEICESEEGHPAWASCLLCEFGCSEGACYPDCTPGDPCCSTSGALIPNCYHDPDSGLDWLNPPSTDLLNWAEAASYCASEATGGYQDWYLPTVDELRTLIDGCDKTETGGACGVTNECLESSTDDCLNDACRGCGLVVDDCYWDGDLTGDCNTYFYWSASESSDQSSLAWHVKFNFARIQAEDKDLYGLARCMRWP
jgi:hypothetical protein